MSFIQCTSFPWITEFALPPSVCKEDKPNIQLLSEELFCYIECYTDDSFPLPLHSSLSLSLSLSLFLRCLILSAYYLFLSPSVQYVVDDSRIVCSIKVVSPCLCSELEQFVDSLKRDSGGTARAVTLKDVEEGAVTLRKVGESLAGLKGKATQQSDHCILCRTVLVSRMWLRVN